MDRPLCVDIYEPKYRPLNLFLFEKLTFMKTIVFIADCIGLSDYLILLIFTKLEYYKSIMFCYIGNFLYKPYPVYTK
jgi:hypothetical protein